MFLRKRAYLEKFDKILYLPIENHLREFHSKLYLAHQACQKGWVVVIGPEYDVNRLVKYLPSGVYFGIGFHRKLVKILKTLKNKGHSFISQDEEGLDRWAPEMYKDYRIDPEVNSFLDYFLCWSKEDKEIIDSAFTKSIKSISVGNLRLDLLNSNLRQIFMEDVGAIKKNYGEFVLINGKFGGVNHAKGLDYYLEDLKARGWIDTPFKKKFHFERIEFQKIIFEKMIELSIALAKSGQKVVVRPHPSENINVWKNKTKNYSKNIKIIRSGNIIPWLMASKLVIHNGCTTAIEGSLLDKTIISYRPNKNQNVETYLPNAVSISKESKEDVINFIKEFDFKKSNLYSKNSSNVLNDYFKLENHKKDTCFKILSIIENLLKKKTIKSINIEDNILIEFEIFKSFVSNFIYKKNFSYMKSKCSGLDKKEVYKNLKLFSKIKKNKNNLKISNLSKNSLIISIND